MWIDSVLILLEFQIFYRQVTFLCLTILIVLTSILKHLSPLLFASFSSVPLLFLIVRGILFTVCKIFALYHLIMNPLILQNFWKKSTALLIISLLGSLLQELNCWVVSQVPFQKEMFVTVNILRTFHFPNWVSKQINSVKWYFNAIIVITYNSISYDGLSISIVQQETMWS